MRVNFIYTNDGIVDPVETSPGITVDIFMKQNLPPEYALCDYTIQVNDAPCRPDQQLRSEDTIRVTLTPTSKAPAAVASPSYSSSSTVAAEQQQEGIPVLLIHAQGDGFAGNVNVPAGTTVLGLLNKHLPNVSLENFVINHNRKVCHSIDSQVLAANDRVSLSPAKIEAGQR